MSYTFKQVKILTLFLDKEDPRYKFISEQNRDIPNPNLCDWGLVENFIKERKPQTLYFGLNGDFMHSKIKILEHGQKIKHPQFVCGSTWAEPVITTTETSEYGYNVFKKVSQEEFDRNCCKASWV